MTLDEANKCQLMLSSTLTNYAPALLIAYRGKSPIGLFEFARYRKEVERKKTIPELPDAARMLPSRWETQKTSERSSQAFINAAGHCSIVSATQLFYVLLATFFSGRKLKTFKVFSELLYLTICGPRTITQLYWFYKRNHDRQNIFKHRVGFN